jgi:hypothetical protein
MSATGARAGRTAGSSTRGGTGSVRRRTLRGASGASPYPTPILPLPS